MSFNGTYIIQETIADVANSLTNEAEASSAVASFLSQPISNTISNIDRQLGISEIYTQFNLVKSDITGITNMFQGGLSIDTSSATGVVDSINNHVENFISTYEHIEGFVDTFTDKFGNITDFASNIGGNIENVLTNAQEQITGIVSSITDFDVGNTLEKLPELVGENLMNINVIADPLIALASIKTTILTITNQLASLRAPTNITTLRELMQKLRTIANAVDAAKSAVERAMNSIKDLASKLQNGEYISVLMSLAQGGVTFCQTPMSYDTIYPSNLSWRTAGGFQYEEDNTPGKERKSMHHPSGTGYYMNPDGTTVFKSVSDTQCTSENIDVNANKSCCITAKEGRIVIKGNCDIEVGGNAKICSIGECTITSAVGGITISATSTVNITSVGNINLSGRDIEISASGLLTLSGGMNPATAVASSVIEGAGLVAGSASAKAPSVPQLGVNIISAFGGVGLYSGIPMVPSTQLVPGCLFVNTTSFQSFNNISAASGGALGGISIVNAGVGAGGINVSNLASTGGIAINNVNEAGTVLVTNMATTGATAITNLGSGVTAISNYGVGGVITSAPAGPIATTGQGISNNSLVGIMNTAAGSISDTAGAAYNKIVGALCNETSGGAKTTTTGGAKTELGMGHMTLGGVIRLN